MKWIKAANKLPRIGLLVSLRSILPAPKYRGAGRIIDETLPFHCTDGLERDFKYMEWLDESDSEPIYTDKDMKLFAEYCGQESQEYRNGQWYFKCDPNSSTTQELFEIYQKTRIPSLPKLS